MSYASTINSETGLVGFWELAEASGTSATDQVGLQNGTYNAGITLGQPGIPGGSGTTSARFTAASSGKMTASINASAVFGSTFSIECWIKRVTTGTTQVLFCGRTQADTGSGPIVYFAGNTLVLDKEDQIGVTSSTSTLTDKNSWHHVVVTSNAGTTVKIWLDNVDVTGSVTTTTYNNESGTFTWGVGRAADHSSAFYDGYMAMCALYKVALSPAQVANHYTLGSTGPATTVEAIGTVFI